jgi:chromosome segregation ATPase
MLAFFAWLVLLAATALLAELAFHFDLMHIPAAFLGLPSSQQVAVVLIALMVLALVASTLWQSYRIARQERYVRSLRGGLAGTQKAMAWAAASQKDFDAAVQHLSTNDPEDTLSNLQKQLADSEARATVQRGRNEAVDLAERLDEIRRRQQALREQLGVVAERRRALEPVFEELKDRQRQLDRSLDKIETDDNNNNFDNRLKEFDQKTASVQARHQALQDSFAMLTRLKCELGKSQESLVALEAPDAGVKALLAKAESERNSLAKAIEALETTGEGESLSARIATLNAGKKDTELRIVRLEGSFAVLDAVRRDLIEFKKRQEDLASAFAAVEIDPTGKTLTERLVELDQFSEQARSRLRALQETLTTLNRYRKDLLHSQDELAPLLAPGEGIQSLLTDLDNIRTELATSLEEIERSGNQTLTARVEMLAGAKRASEQRVAEVYRHFAELASIRDEIASVFADLNGALSKFG